MDCIHDPLFDGLQKIIGLENKNGWCAKVSI
jgi:hypothetical protein